MNYRLVYELAAELERGRSEAWAAAVASSVVCLAVVLGGAVVGWRRSPGTARHALRRDWPVLVLLVVVAGGVGPTVCVLATRNVLSPEQCRAWLQAGDYRVTEGEVAKVFWVPGAKGQVKKFRVDTHEFVYPSKAEGVREGDRVRVTHHGDTILRFEKAE